MCVSCPTTRQFCSNVIIENIYNYKIMSNDNKHGECMYLKRIMYHGLTAVHNYVEKLSYAGQFDSTYRRCARRVVD